MTRWDFVAVAFVAWSWNTQAAWAGCPELIQPSPEVDSYAAKIAESFKPNAVLEDKLQTILSVLHGKDGIASRPFTPQLFFDLRSVFRGQGIESVAALRSISPKAKELASFVSVT